MQTPRQRRFRLTINREYADTLKAIKYYEDTANCPIRGSKEMLDMYKANLQRIKEIADLEGISIQEENK